MFNFQNIHTVLAQCTVWVYLLLLVALCAVLLAVVLGYLRRVTLDTLLESARLEAIAEDLAPITVPQYQLHTIPQPSTWLADESGETVLIDAILDALYHGMSYGLRATNTDYVEQCGSAANRIYAAHYGPLS